MTSGLMRRFSTSARTQLLTCPARSLTAPRLLGLKQYKRNITAVGAKQASVSRHWFTSSSPCKHPEPDERGKERLNERNLKLGNSKLVLCRAAHQATDTTTVLGNVKLEILSERMVKNGASSASNVRNEKLIVRWQTCKSEKKDNGQVSDVVEKITSIVAGSKRPHQEFTGLFKFEFDEEGRILNHIIEHTEEGQHWDRTAKVISVTDWLLGRAWGRREEVSPSLAFARCWREKNSRGRGERR